MSEPVRVNIYGDSIMRATVIDEELRYHSTIAELLRRMGECFGLAFKCRARFGSTVAKGRQVLERDLAAGLDCGYAVLAFGGNDCSFNWEAVAKAPGTEHRPFTELEDFRRHYTEMALALQHEGVQPVLMTMPPLDAERHLHFIGKTDEGRQNILGWLGDAAMIYRFHELYSHAVEEIAHKTKALLVDVRQRFLQRHDLGRLLGLDGVHLSPAGYQLVYEAFADFVRSYRMQREAALARA